MGGGNDDDGCDGGGRVPVTLTAGRFVGIGFTSGSKVTGSEVSAAPAAAVVVVFVVAVVVGGRVDEGKCCFFKVF